MSDKSAPAPTEKHVAILGIRGLPANHGGFETFAEVLSLALVERSWTVAVYCQVEANNPQKVYTWNQITLIDIPVKLKGAVGTIEFDIKSTLHACRHYRNLLTLGYNTGFLSIYCKLRRAINIINMDGIEWRRQKWSFPVKAWFYLNERIACWFGNHLIADNHWIRQHLVSRVNENKATMIPYGAFPIETADEEHLNKLDLEPRQYVLVIARPEKENSIVEIVRAFSAERRDVTLVVLGNYLPEHSYHAEVTEAASDEVRFVGAIYDQAITAALRFYALAYVHGHQVGGTNPALVEAMGAGCAVIAHDNRFNRWVTEDRMRYFNTETGLADIFATILADSTMLDELRSNSRRIYRERFTWDEIVDQYESLMMDCFNHKKSIAGTTGLKVQ